MTPGRDEDDSRRSGQRLDIEDRDEPRALSQKLSFQTMEQARAAFPHDTDRAHLCADTTVFFRMRKVERILATRRLGFAEIYPPIVVICGSGRFHQEMQDANRELTLAGCVVLAPGVFQQDGDEAPDGQKAVLDELHLRKIDLADQVLVVDPGGCIDESTRREIAYAETRGKPVAYVSRHDPAADHGPGR